MIDSMKFGTYIFFAFFSGAGGAFVWFFCPGQSVPFHPNPWVLSNRQGQYG
jgi:hypothetical protein